VTRHGHGTFETGIAAAEQMKKPIHLAANCVGDLLNSKKNAITLYIYARNFHTR